MIDDSELFRINFWTKLETKLGTIVPIHVKNICKYNSLDNPLSFRNLNEDVLQDIEKFVQTELLELIPDKDENLQHYFGFYYKKPENFKFAIGEKFLLLEMAEFVRSKSREFFAINTANNLADESSNIQKKAVFPTNFNIKNSDRNAEFSTSFEEHMPSKSEESFSMKDSFHSDESSLFDNTTNTFPSSPGAFNLDLKVKTKNSGRGHDDVTKLTRQVRTLIKACPAGLLPEISKRAKKLDIHIEKIEEGNSTYLEASIACPICDCSVTCKRTVGVDGSRWKMNNFNKHIKVYHRQEADNKSFDIKNEPFL